MSSNTAVRNHNDKFRYEPEMCLLYAFCLQILCLFSNVGKFNIRLMIFNFHVCVNAASEIYDWHFKYYNLLQVSRLRQSSIFVFTF